MSLQRPDLHLDVDDDKEKAVATRKRILDMVATEKLFVAGFHMPYPGLGYVEKAGSAYRWVPHSYQLNCVRHGGRIQLRSLPRKRESRGCRLEVCGPGSPLSRGRTVD